MTRKMKKIMFNDRYGLTRAVLDGRKTMTRRIINLCENDLEFMKISDQGEYLFCSKNALDGAFPKYQIGEVVAVAQAYKNNDVLSFNAYENVGAYHLDGLKRHKEMLSSAGYRNKMFVKAEYMPYRIRITDIKVERLQGISDEDCLREGIRESIVEFGGKKIVQWTYFHEKRTIWFDSPREAFASLIDRISGKGTWERNPWCFAYSFELIK